jgi:hypothetical protein
VVEAVEGKIEKRTIEVLSGIDESVKTKKALLWNPCQNNVIYINRELLGLPHDAQPLDS